MYKKRYLTFISLYMYTGVAYADLPLTVEDLTTDKNRFKLDTSVSYYNQSDSGLNLSGYSLVDLGNGRTLSIPNNLSEGIDQYRQFNWQFWLTLWGNR